MKVLLIITICLTLAAAMSGLYINAYDKEYDNKDK